ncbi:MAG: thiamine-phosphate kinase [Bacteroidales bacterium]|nr:thiamine-phosphate kinase [Bacteroidales bacterium]
MPEEKKSDEKGFGKFALIEELQEQFRSFFDDGESLNNITHTLYLEGIHFNLMYFPLKHLGYKAVIDSIADLYCRSIKPQIISVNIGLSVRFKKEDIEEIIEGICLACDRHSLRISSLDINSSLTGLAISIASSGKETDSLTGGMPVSTDLICVSGDLGAAFLGLQLLERERTVFEDTGGAQPKLEGFEYVIGRQLKPELRVDILGQIRMAGIHPGLIRTVRDGIASELIHISKAAGVGCRIYHDRLPIHHDTAAAGQELGFEPLIAALNGGDDFEFVFTCPVKEHDKIEKIDGISIAGHLVPREEGKSLVLQDGSLAELKAQGWEGEEMSDER